MPRTDIDRLIARWMETELEECEDYRAVCGPVSDDYREGVYLALSTQFDEASEALVSCNYKTVEREADDVLKAAGLPVLDHASVDFGRLCRKLLQARQDVLRIEADRWDGVYERGASVSDKRTAVEAPPLPQATTSVAPAVPVSLPFSQVVALHAKECPRPGRTAGQVQAEFERFHTVLGGDLPIASITKAHGRAYKDDMLTRRKLSLLTCIKHLSILSAVFKWAESNGHIPDGSNPVKGLAPNKRVAKKQAAQRRPFTDAELLTVFGSQDFLKQRDTYPARYWLILLCTFQGCRREEAGQLNLKDLGEDRGVPYIHITNEGEGQSIKNEGSKRRLPVHSSLVKLGLLEYVERIKAGGHTRLFPQLTRNINGYSDSVGKYFTRLLTKLGLTDPALCLHGLRHTFIHRLHAAGVPQNIAEVLAGHSADSVHEKVYAHRGNLPLSLLRESLEKLRYDAVVKALG